MADNIFQGEMDPEIAALLGAVPSGQAGTSPDYSAIFDDGQPAPAANAEADKVNLRNASFPAITKKLEDVPNAAFSDPEYYKSALSGEGQIAQRVHQLLQKYINSKDPKDKGVYRQQFITAYWEFLQGVARKAPGKIPDAKKYLLRFAMIHPSFVDADTRNLVARVVVNNNLGEPLYYLDEWFKAVGTGAVRASTTDEVRVAKSNNAVRLQQLLEKAQGKLDGSRSLLKAKDDERLNQEQILQDRVKLLLEHFPVDGIPGINACYSETQKRAFSEIQETLKNLLKIDHDLDLELRDYYQSEQDVKSLEQKVEEEGGGVTVDVKAVDTEFETVRQMTKMVVGRQGNHFPVLLKEYFHCLPQDVGYRENVLSLMAWIESIDPEVFCRSHKNRLNRIVPYVVLIPAYGDYGMCWEPFDRFNRATSRGRIAIPMYPKSLQNAVLSAVADLRWQVAKERASFYWMEEGITGNYYQWFQKMKMKGDVKEAFIEDYIIWMTKESDAVQKLDKEVRGIFWRHIPFSQAIKEKLKGRSYVYQDLYQRDVNRSMSDGY